MSVTIAITGKSGSGKTTLAKSLMKTLQKKYPEKSILIVDNDLSGEFGHTFGLDIRNTIYGIRSGKHEYKTGIPSKMTKSEYIEWALQDILVSLDENVDLIVSWLVATKDCRCPITKQMNDALVKLLSNYDFVIFDCEFDLKYLIQLVDIPIDLTLIVTLPIEESVNLTQRIEEYSAKYASDGQIGVVLNKVHGNEENKIYELLNKYSLDVLGIIPYDESLLNNLSKNSENVDEALEGFYSRLNLPQNNL